MSSNLRISFANDLLHTSLYFGFLINCRYSSKSPVSLSKTAWAHLHMKASGYRRAAACLFVNLCGASALAGLGPAIGRSIMLYVNSCVTVCSLRCCHVFAAGVDCMSSSSCEITLLLLMFPMSIAGYLSISNRTSSVGVGVAVSSLRTLSDCALSFFHPLCRYCIFFLLRLCLEYAD